MYKKSTITRPIHLRESWQTRNAAIPTMAEKEMQAHIDIVKLAFPASDSKPSEISKAPEHDKACKQAKKYCSEQWPNKKILEHNIKPYYQPSWELTIVKGLLMRDSRIVIPKSQQQETLAKKHEGHQGIHKCRTWANRSVWWLGISSQIKTMVENCN